MNTQEIGAFLGLVALHDNRKIGAGDVMAWEDVLPPEINFTDARAALRAHRQAGPDWLMPSHIIERVKAIRKERLTRAGTPPIPGGLEYADEQAWRQLWCAAVKDGHPDPKAVANHAMKLGPAGELIGMPVEVRAAITRFAADHAVPELEACMARHPAGKGRR